jgi:hypothetical protein
VNHQERRDLFIAAALQGLLAAVAEGEYYGPEAAAVQAIAMADAVLSADAKASEADRRYKKEHERSLQCAAWNDGHGAPPDALNPHRVEAARNR